MTPYDEEEQLTIYLWHNYYLLFRSIDWRACVTELTDPTPEESATIRAVLTPDREFFRTAGFLAHAHGSKTLRHLAAKRLLREFESEIQIARCAMCNRITRTPRSQQCFWCGFDWHASE